MTESLTKTHPIDSPKTLNEAFIKPQILWVLNISPMKKMFHYTDCGLDNVWLESGFASKETKYGPAFAVQALVPHKWLVKALKAKRTVTVVSI